MLEMEVSGILKLVKAQKVFKFNLRFAIVCKSSEKNCNSIMYITWVKQVKQKGKRKPSLRLQSKIGRGATCEKPKYFFLEV